MFLLVSTRFGTIVRVDAEPVEYGSGEAWPDYVVVECVENIEIPEGSSVALDILPEHYRCTANELTAALVPGVVELYRTADGQEVLTVNAVDVPSEREVDKREKRTQEIAVFRELQTAVAARCKADSDLRIVEHALAGSGIDLGDAKQLEKKLGKAVAIELSKLKPRQEAAAMAEALVKAQHNAAKRMPDSEVAPKKVKGPRG